MLKRAVLVDVQQLDDGLLVVAFLYGVHHVYLLPSAPLARHVLLTHLLELQDVLTHALDGEAVGLIAEAALVDGLDGVDEGFGEERGGVLAGARAVSGRWFWDHGA